MKRHRHLPRVRISSVVQEATSRPHGKMCTPLWLVLYWIDLAILTSGYFSRRRLLRLRNDLLTFLDVQTGSAWEVGVYNKQGKNK